MSGNEWYTPKRYIHAAKQVMGDIDLDPASCELANKTVQAKSYYTKEQNGLMLPWYGRIWLNPPYGRVQPELKGSTRSYQKYFVLTFLDKYLSGEIEQGIALIFGASACTPWFLPLFRYPVCVSKAHIDFNTPHGEKARYGYGNMFVYLGPDETRFTEIFSQYGPIVKSIT